MMDSMSAHKAIVITGLMALVVLKRRKAKSRRALMKNQLCRKNLHQAQLINQLQDDPDDFRNYLRMDESTLVKLLGLVKVRLQKKDTIMRQAIPAEKRLMATLKYLASGRSLKCISDSTGISNQCLSNLIPETCKILHEVLIKEYMKFPRSKEDWLKISKNFSEKWNFFNCGGALDGRHIRIVKPRNFGTKYYNYKGFYSIVLMALVDADYKFTWFDVGKPGQMSDGVFEWTDLCNNMKNEALNFPKPEDNDMGLEYVFIGDEKFTLNNHLLNPYAQSELTNDKRIFNYRLSRARNVVEEAFGMLSNRFRILHASITVNVESAKCIVAAVCLLHNFLQTECGVTRYDIPPLEQSANFINLQGGINRSASIANSIRDGYCLYFNGVGKVDCEEEMIRSADAELRA